MIDQAFIASFGVTAIYLSQCESVKAQKFASVFGLCSQPFWFYATFTAEQWGIFALCFCYTLAWWKGFYRHWVKKI